MGNNSSTAIVRCALVVVAYAIVAGFGSQVDSGYHGAAYFENGVTPSAIGVALLSPFWFGFYYHGPIFFLVMTILTMPFWVAAAFRLDRIGLFLGAIGGVLWTLGSLGIVSVL